MFTENTFIYSGCVQALGDHAGIALMCPNGNVPSGSIKDNNFINCPGVESIYMNPHEAWLNRFIQRFGVCHWQ